MSECWGGVLAVARRELLGAPPGKRGEVLRDGPKRREGDASRLVGQRDVNVRASREGLEQRPLRSRQILEPVRKHRLPVPRVQIAREPLGRRAAQHVPVRKLESRELRSIRRVQLSETAVELIGVDQPRFELAERPEQGVGKARVPRRAAEPVEPRQRRRDRVPGGERTADRARH